MNAEGGGNEVAQECKNVLDLIVATRYRTKNFQSSVSEYLKAQSQLYKTLDTTYDDIATVQSATDAYEKSSNVFETLLAEIEEDCS